MSKLIGNPVDHPSHYTAHFSGIEAIVFTEQLNFNLGNAFKYVYRHEEKWDAVEDLRKAIWYIDREQFRISQYLGVVSKTNYSLEVLNRIWDLDNDRLNSQNIIYKVVSNPAAYMDKALFYIWAQAFGFNNIADPLLKAKHYINLILENKQKEQQNDH